MEDGGKLGGGGGEDEAERWEGGGKGGCGGEEIVAEEGPRGGAAVEEEESVGVLEGGWLDVGGGEGHGCEDLRKRKFCGRGSFQVSRL